MKFKLSYYFILLVIFLVTLFPIYSQAQQLVYSSILFGGVTGNGCSVANGSGTINFPIQIPPNSTIKKAFLIAARDSLADDITITLNGMNYTFSNTTISTNGFIAYNQSSIFRPNSSMHLLDITNDIDSSINNYSLYTPPQPNGFKGAYMFFYLYVVFENSLLPKIACNLFLNIKDVAPITNYNLTNVTPLSVNKSVCLGVATTYFCDTLLDGSYVAVNGNTIGLIGGEDLNSNLWTCIGTWANFAHYNDSLFGLDDDNPDSLMMATDALADIKSYVNNGDTAVDVTFTYQTLDNSNGGIYTNPIRAIMLSYTTPCNTFTTTATTNTDTVCAGETVQLNATGGAIYSWYSAFSTFNDSTLANPIATPTQTTTYIVTIKNDSGCVKTEHVKIWVNPAPQPDTIIITPQNCGNSDGKIVVGNIANGASPFTYQLTDLATGNLQSQISNFFNNLLAGNYLLSITDANGCTWQSDTLVVPVVNNTQANFITNPQPPFSNPTKSVGKAPLPVDFINQSTLATNYEWFIIYQTTGDTIFTTNLVNFTYEFIVGGTFELCLIAYNTFPICADTLCKTIYIDDDLSIIISNLLTPNGDGKNDTWYISNVNQIDGCSVMIFNRWGSKLFETTNYNNDWEGTYNGQNLPDGAYFYVIVCEDQTYKGPLTLLR